jgi:hypothetical protein
VAAGAPPSLRATMAACTLTGEEVLMGGIRVLTVSSS